MYFYYSKSIREGNSSHTRSCSITNRVTGEEATATLKVILFLLLVVISGEIATIVAVTVLLMMLKAIVTQI